MNDRRDNDERGIMDTNVLQFRLRPRRSWLLKEVPRAPKRPEKTEEQKFYESLDEITDPDERLVEFARRCLLSPDFEKTDALLVEAHQRKKSEQTPEAWYAIAAYAFLHDQPRRYWGIDQVIKYSGGRPTYYAMCLDLIAHQDPYAEQAKKYCTKLSNDLLYMMPEDKQAMAIVANARTAILQDTEERVKQDIIFARQRKRFRTK